MTKVKDYYLIRKLKDNPETYEVAKFDDDSIPAGIYNVALDRDKGLVWCSCMGFRSMQFKPLSDPKAAEHKHIRLVGEFLHQGKPWLTVFWFDKEFNIQSKGFGLPMKEILNVK